jgi:predicted nucleic acid-binding protein
VIAWLVRNDTELALPTVTFAEIAFIGKTRPDQRSARVEQGWQRCRFADRVFPWTEAAALAYADMMSAALRQGRPMTAPDGMIAAIAHINGGRLATRNLPDFGTTGLDLIYPWDFWRQPTRSIALEQREDLRGPFGGMYPSRVALPYIAPTSDTFSAW